MTEAIKYPIETVSGDLSLVSELEDLAITRGWIFLDVRIGEREFFPDYGNTTNLFLAATNIMNENTEFQMDILSAGLNRWAVVRDKFYIYELQDLSNQTFDRFQDPSVRFLINITL
jgi:hypothetical protein